MIGKLIDAASRSDFDNPSLHEGNTTNPSFYKL